MFLWFLCAINRWDLSLFWKWCLIQLFCAVDELHILFHAACEPIIIIISCFFRYHEYKDKAWNWSEILTPHGKKLCENAFAKINPRDYGFSVEQTLERISCTITRYSSNTTNTCWFPTEYKQGSLFGGCSSGRPSTDGIPCDHICAVIKSRRIDGLTETNVMPTWWHTSFWHKQ